MVKRDRITANPLKAVELLSDNGEKRRPRRALSDEEFANLTNTSGERGVVYLVAATTGLRFGEMMGIELRDIRLDEAEPLKLNLGGRDVKSHLRDLLDGNMPRRIAVAGHCYGCTAGAGSSCGGAVAE